MGSKLTGLYGRYRAGLAVIASLFLLAACSSTTFVYNRLPTILPWYLDDYVDLNGHQEQQLDQTLQPFLRWHRLQELPRYVSILDEIDSNLDRAVTPEDISAIYSGVEVAWLRLQDESLNWLLDLGAGLSDQQVREFLVALQDQQEELEQEYLSRTDREYREESYDSLQDSMQNYLGRLTPEQRQLLRAASVDLERSDALWLQERAAWLVRLEVLLQREAGWQQQLRDAIAQREETVSARYTETFEHNLGVIFGTVAEVLNSRSGKQDQHLRAELRTLRDELQTLIAQGERSPAEAA